MIKLPKPDKEIVHFLEEAQNFEELELRTALVKVPDFTFVQVSGFEYFYFKGEWLHDLPFGLAKKANE